MLLRQSHVERSFFLLELEHADCRAYVFLLELEHADCRADVFGCSGFLRKTVALKTGFTKIFNN